MAERIELEISTQGMRAGAEEAKALLASIPKAAGQAARDADAELKRAAASAKSFTDAMERQSSAEVAARQRQASATNNARVAAVAQNTVLQKQIAIQKQVLSGLIPLSQAQEQLARVTIDTKVKNDALSASLAKSRTEYAANAAAIKAAQAAQTQAAAATTAAATATKTATVAVNGLKASLTALQSSFILLAVLKLIKDFVGMADTAKQLEGQLKLVTNSAQQLAQVQEALFQSAQRSRSSLAGAVDLYARLARNSKELGASQQDLLEVTETVGKAIQISGVSASAANAALVQLGQGFASGVLRGEELNSVMEQTPRVAQAIAEGMGVTIGQLRALGQAGELTAKAVFGALKSQKDAIDKEFGQLPVTVGQAMTLLGNEVLRFVGFADKATGASGLLARGVQGAANAFHALSEAVRAASVEEKLASISKAIVTNQERLRQLNEGGSWLDIAFGMTDRAKTNTIANLKELEQAYEKLANPPKLITEGTYRAVSNGVYMVAGAYEKLGQFLVPLTKEEAKFKAEVDKTLSSLEEQAAKTRMSAREFIDWQAARMAAGEDGKKWSELEIARWKELSLQVLANTEAKTAATKATKAATSEAEKEANALQKARAGVMQETEILRQQADIYQDVIDGKIGLSDAEAKMSAIRKSAKADSDGLSTALENEKKRFEDNKTAVENNNKAIDELIKRTADLKKAIDDTTNSLEEEARIQQVGLTTLKQAVAGGKTFAEGQKAAARAVELTTTWLQEYNKALSKGAPEGFARQVADEMTALKEKTLDAKDAADDFGTTYEEAMDSAILKTSDLRSMFNEVIDDLLSGGKNLMDKFKEFGKDMGTKLIEGIAFGKKGLEDQVLIPNFSQLFGQNGIVGSIFQSGGQSAGSSFVSGFASWITGTPNFSNVISGGSSTAGTAAGTAWGSGFLASAGSILGGTAAGMGIGSWANQKMGIGQSKQGKMGGMVGGAVGGIAGGGIIGGTAMGAALGSIVPGLGTLIGAAIGAIIGMIGGGLMGDLFAPGRIQQEKMGLVKYYEKVFDGLNFKEMSEKAVAKGFVDYDAVRNAGETLGVIFADSMGKGATQGTMIRFPGQLFANFRKMGLSVEEAKEKVLELSKAMGVDFAGSITTVNEAMNTAAKGPTLLGLGITKEEIKEARKNLKEYGDTSAMTIKELDALALAHGNVGSTIITLNQLYAGAVDLQTGFADHAASVAGVNGLLADKFKEVATTGGMAGETITDLSEKVRNGTLSVEEALLAYNKWAESAGKTKLALQDVALDAEAFDPLTGSIKESNASLEELLSQLQAVDQQLVALAERQINIRTSLAGNLKDIGAISPLEEITGRLDAAATALARSRAVVNPDRRHQGDPGATAAERLQLANDLAAYRQVLVEDFQLRKAAIEQGREASLAAVTKWEQEATAEVQARYAGQRQALQAEMDAARAAGQAAIDAARAQGQALIEAARAQGQAAIEAARAQGQAEVEAARKQGQEEVEAARAAGDAIIAAQEARAEAEMALLEKEKEALTEAARLREEALTAEIDLLSQWRDLATSLGEQIHALITAAESPLSRPEQFGAIQRETERARQRLEGTSGAARIPAMQDLARLLGEQLSASPYQRLDPRQRELFSKLTQELQKLQQEAGREGAPLEDKQAQLLMLQAQSADALKSIDARIEAARVEQDVARERAEVQANALVEAAEAAAEARNAAAEAAAEARNNAAQAHAQAIADAAQQQAEALLEAAEAGAAARQKEIQDKMDALSVAEQAELAAITEKATQERNAVNIAADQHQADLLTEYTQLLKDLAAEEAEQIALIEEETRTKRQEILDQIMALVENSEELNSYNQQQGEVLGRLAAALEALNSFLANVTQAQGGMYDPQLSSNRLILAHRGETVAIGQPTRGTQPPQGAAVSIGSIVINGTASTTKAEVKAMVEEAVVQSIRPQGAARAEMKRQGVKFA